MPELPDLEAYRVALAARVLGKRLEQTRLRSPFVLRSIDPPMSRLESRRLIGTRRLGKRLVLAFEDELFLVIHLMIAGRLRWREPGQKPGRELSGRHPLASFAWGGGGNLWLTEAGSKKRASIHVVQGESALAAHDPGGLEVLDSALDAFSHRLREGNHTLKRALTDPGLFAGIGNAYSDEILHRARISPFLTTARLDATQVETVWRSAREVLGEWTNRLVAEATAAFPEKVTAFRSETTVHGRFGQPCPVCGTAVQRLVYTENEANYCPTCQTGGRLLADRALSRLLKGDWPRTLEELEHRKASARQPFVPLER